MAAKSFLALCDLRGFLFADLPAAVRLSVNLTSFNRLVIINATAGERDPAIPTAGKNSVT
jgi:hypothetical protein